MRERARHPRHPREAEHRGHEQHDVAARDGQQVRQARRPEVLDGGVGERRGSAQRDARRDARLLVVAAGQQRGPRPAAQPVERACEPAAPADHREVAGRERLVHALARQPRATVEPARGGRHRRQRAADLDDRALDEIAACAQLDGVPVELRDRRAAERPRARLPVDDEPHPTEVPGARGQRIGRALHDAVGRPERSRDDAAEHHGGGRGGEQLHALDEREQREHDQPPPDRP